MFEKKKKDERFIIKEAQSLGFGGLHVVVDTETGVYNLIAFLSLFSIKKYTVLI